MNGFINYSYERGSETPHHLKVFKNMGEDNTFKGKKTFLKIDHNWKSEILARFKKSAFFNKVQLKALAKLAAQKVSGIITPDGNILQVS